MPTERRLAAIMFTDIVGSTALTARSEVDGLQAKQKQRAIVRRQVDR
jgi:class 3 adenylate cyclase